MVQDSSPRKSLKKVGCSLAPLGVVLLRNTVVLVVVVLALGAIHPKQQQQQARGAYQMATVPQAPLLRKVRECTWSCCQKYVFIVLNATGQYCPPATLV
jgi:hypothetical protein